MTKFMHLTMHTGASLFLTFSYVIIHLVTISLPTWLLNEETATFNVAKHLKDVLYVLIWQNDLCLLDRKIKAQDEQKRKDIGFLKY